MAAPPASGATPGRAGGCSGLFGRAFICFVRRHTHRLPRET
jgi:hypothetical protein